MKAGSMEKKAYQRYQRGKKAIVYNLFLNLALALFKGVIGYMSRSQAMMADAFHSGGDMMVNVIVLLGLKESHRPADDCHPYGHGKAETLAQNIVGLLIMATGFYLIISSLVCLWAGMEQAPGSLALVAALVSIVIKEVLFRYMLALGQKLNSRALIANAWDHRSDVLSSLAALLGIGGARLGAYLGYPVLYHLDPLAGAVVAVLIIRMGLEIMKESGRELMDGTCPPETLEDICAIALKVPRVREIHRVRARSSGPCLLIDLEIGVDRELSVQEGHNVSHEVEEQLLRSREDIHLINVHVAPVQDGKG